MQEAYGKKTTCTSDDSVHVYTCIIEYLSVGIIYGYNKNT